MAATGFGACWTKVNMNGIIKMTVRIPAESGNARTGAFGYCCFPAARRKNAKSLYLLGNGTINQYNKDIPNIQS